MTITTEHQDLAPEELDLAVVRREAVTQLRMLVYALNGRDSLGSHLLEVALYHFEEESGVPHWLTP